MNIDFPGVRVAFRPWQPRMGRVFDSDYAFDTETTAIDEQHFWITPAYVIGAACDGRRGWFITREHAAEFFAAHADVPVVMHNAAFDLEVLDVLVNPAGDQRVDVYQLVERNLVWDTQLLHKLYMLGSDGHVARGRGQSTLERCAELYLNIPLPKDVRDSEGRDVRTSYGRWLGRPPGEIEHVYLEYLARDVATTYRVYQQLRERLDDLLKNCHCVWGFVTAEWLGDQIRRWGPQTHHIQLKAAIVLQAVTANGIGVDVYRRDELIAHLDDLLDEFRGRLREYGYVPGQRGTGKALQEILSRLERRQGRPFPRTPTGQIQTSRESLSDMAIIDPFIAALLEYRETEKLKNSFLTKMGRGRLHPSFNPMMVTGRTSSFGEINAQNLPRDDRVRALFVPADGHVFLTADYKTVELATLAQTVQSQFGVPSRMAAGINAGVDLHRLVAAHVTGKPIESVTRAERQMAKPINFGKPGGMGHEGLKKYARASYGVDLTDEEVNNLTDAWFTLFPEMDHYLRSSELTNLGEQTARLFGLTPQGHFEHTGSRRFIDHPDNFGREQQPHSILGWMCLKALCDVAPQTREGRPYLCEDIDYFWTRVAEHLDILPDDCRAAVHDRLPSPRLRQAVARVADRGSCITATGRLRANASYTARHNTLFQGLAADGAKLAMWKLWRAGYRIVNFVHDEFLIELPDGSDLTRHAETVSQLMVAGMREVVPDILVEVDFALCDRWYKAAEAVYDMEGRLVPWYPASGQQVMAAVALP